MVQFLSFVDSIPVVFHVGLNATQLKPLKRCIVLTCAAWAKRAVRGKISDNSNRAYYSKATNRSRFADTVTAPE